MKKNIQYIIGIFTFLSIFLLISSCHKRTLLEDDYSDFRRVVGPEGGTINFYEYNPGNNIPEITVSMEIPPDALDSFVVFNMYEYYEDAVHVDLNLMGREINTKFLYFVPFYESIGYNEYRNDPQGYHESIDFKSPVKIGYNLNFYNIELNAELYRIKIPRLNEWGTGSDNNVYINWNQQGYPEGYYNLDLMYLINGRWAFGFDWGNAPYSFVNWEPVDGEYKDLSENIMYFYIENTDYMYVMAYDIPKNN